MNQLQFLTVELENILKFDMAKIVIGGGTTRG